MGCFTDQVKLTRALVQNLDEAVKEVKLLGEHEEDLLRLEDDFDDLDGCLNGDRSNVEE
jgi:hypothetical protein